MRRLRHLTGQHRTARTHRLLGGLLAFNAGAIKAGGFSKVGMSTSPMTGFAAMLALSLPPLWTDLRRKARIAPLLF